MVVRDFNTPHLPIDRSSRRKPNKEISELNGTIIQMDLAAIYRVFHPALPQHTFFSAVHGTFSKIDHILRHKGSLSKCKKIEMTPCIPSDIIE
jgi:hypothetical protein